MKTHSIEPQSFEFHFHDLDTLVCVEHRQDDEVVIRATRNTFSEERKLCFIRELVAEGFVPDDCQWFYHGSGTSGHTAIRWFVDYSWCKLNPNATAETRRFVVRILVGGILLWLLLMAGLFLSSTQRGLSSDHHSFTMSKTHG